MFTFKHAALIGTAAMAIAAPAAAQESGDGRFNGIYVGVSGGYDVQPNDVGERILFDRNLDGNFNDAVVTTTGANAFSPGFCNGRATSTAPTACRNDRDGWNYNARAGADVQYGKIVVGAVGEFGRSEIRDSVSAFSTTPANYVMRRRVEWEANARGRLGYVAGDSTLFYGTAGVGYARIDHDFYSSNTLNAYELRGDKNKWGFVGGGGIEQQLGDSGFSVGLEYTYHQYNDDETRVRVTRGAQPATNPFVLAPNTAGTDFARSDERFKWHSLRATAAFRF